MKKLGVLIIGVLLFVGCTDKTFISIVAPVVEKKVCKELPEHANGLGLGLCKNDSTEVEDTIEIDSIDTE